MSLAVPDQTATEISMMFMAAKPATATRRSKYFCLASPRSCLAASIGAAWKPYLVERGDESNSPARAGS